MSLAVKTHLLYPGDMGHAQLGFNIVYSTRVSSGVLRGSKLAVVVLRFYVRPAAAELDLMVETILSSVWTENEVPWLDSVYTVC